MTTYYFQIDGRIQADSEDEATEQLYNLLKDKCDIFQITKMEKVE